MDFDYSFNDYQYHFFSFQGDIVTRQMKILGPYSLS